MEALSFYQSGKSDPLKNGGAMLRMAGQWIGRAAKSVAENPEWDATQKGMVLQAYGKLIMRRLSDRKLPDGMWSLSSYRTSAGHIVVTGAVHRIVILNRPGAPILK